MRSRVCGVCPTVFCADCVFVRVVWLVLALFWDPGQGSWNGRYFTGHLGVGNQGTHAVIDGNQSWSDTLASDVHLGNIPRDSSCLTSCPLELNLKKNA